MHNFLLHAELGAATMEREHPLLVLHTEDGVSEWSWRESQEPEAAAVADDDTDDEDGPSSEDDSGTD